jgi:hypothetical protein
VKLRAVNSLGSGTSSLGSTKSTPAEVTSYTIKVYDNYPTDNELVETVTGNTTGSYSRSHYQAERDWSITVAAVNQNGTGSYSSESSTATGWRYSGYSDPISTSRGCTTSSGCQSCGTKSRTESGSIAQTCYKWTRSGCTESNGLNCVSGSTTWSGVCSPSTGCSGSWNSVEPSTSGRANGSYWVDYAYGYDPRLIVFQDYSYFFFDQNLCAVCNCGAGENIDFYTVEKCSVTGAFRWTSHECFTIYGP